MTMIMRKMMIMIMRKMVSLVTVHELRRLYLDKEMVIMLVRMTIIMMWLCVLSYGNLPRKNTLSLGFAKTVLNYAFILGKM